MEYVHLQAEDLGYNLTEKILEYKERKILYLLSELTNEFVLGCDQSSIQPSETKTIYVKGKIIRWKYKTDENDKTISEIEPIKQKQEQDEIKKILGNEYQTSNIYFER
ncbi:MAG: hypothetical protein QMD14_00250 [Candidatus Aenigmarchaeota archaeon]|nr:hypothetical protein [Candidatus Aenigmarchaeota archaeon]